MNNGSDQATDGCNFPENSRKIYPSIKQWMRDSWESQVGNPGEMIYRLLCCTSGFRKLHLWGIFLLQNCVGVSCECEWGRSHHLYYFLEPQFSISPSWAPLAEEELSVYIQDIGNPISHNWDIFILYRQFSQLKHIHANGKVLQRYVLQSFIAHTLNYFSEDKVCRILVC